MATTYPYPFEKCVEYPITALTEDIVKNMAIHSTRSSIRRAAAIKEMIYAPASDDPSLPALNYILEGTFDRDVEAISYANVTEYNEAKGLNLTPEQFEALPAEEKIKVPAHVENVKMYSLHALSCDISKYLLLNSLSE